MKEIHVDMCNFVLTQLEKHLSEFGRIQKTSAHECKLVCGM